MSELGSAVTISEEIELAADLLAELLSAGVRRGREVQRQFVAVLLGAGGGVGGECGRRRDAPRDDDGSAHDADGIVRSPAL
jgi:hypothetical protein